MRSKRDLVDAVYDGAVKRVRPKIMTASVILAGLLPIMWSHGTGADVMKRIAAPMVGGVITSVIVVLVVYPAIYYIWRGWRLPRTAELDANPRRTEDQALLPAHTVRRGMTIRGPCASVHTVRG
jgi:copper/silver efflux system protein